MIGLAVGIAGVAGFGFFLGYSLSDNRAENLKAKHKIDMDTAINSYMTSINNLASEYEEKIEKLKYKVDSQFMVIEERKAQIHRLKASANGTKAAYKMPRRYTALQKKRKELSQESKSN